MIIEIRNWMKNLFPRKAKIIVLKQTQKKVHNVAPPFVEEGKVLSFVPRMRK